MKRDNSDAEKAIVQNLDRQDSLNLKLNEAFHIRGENEDKIGELKFKNERTIADAERHANAQLDMAEKEKDRLKDEKVEVA